MAEPQVVRQVGPVRQLVGEWRKRGERIALVPTMGALHAGHISLVEEARRVASRVVVSIFINPIQFAPNEDFAGYPRDEQADLAKLTGVDVVFGPAVEEMYPQGFATVVEVAGPAEGLETDFRPHFFRGVATVVGKLLLAVAPDVALFGEKDYQQLLVIRRMVTDLNIPVDVIGHPTMREADGLALSSRNTYLSAAERKLAPRLFAVLNEAAVAIRSQSDPQEVLLSAHHALGEAGFRVDYFELRNAETLKPPLDVRSEPLRLLVAARLGKTRLIDNIPV